MSNKISLVFPYYKNPGMLAYQLGIWQSYPKDLLDCIEIIIVDDGSPIGLRAEEVISKSKPSTFPLHLFRIIVDLPWNMCAARNLGIVRAANDWIFFTDIDHIVPESTLRGVMFQELDQTKAYTFTRIEHKTKEQYKAHWETTLLHKVTLAKIGLFDESFCGHYSYSERDWLPRRKPYEAMLPFPIERCSYEDFPDCKTFGWPRQVGRDEAAWQDMLDWKKAHNVGITTLRLPWKQVL